MDYANFNLKNFSFYTIHYTPYTIPLLCISKPHHYRKCNHQHLIHVQPFFAIHNFRVQNYEKKMTYTNVYATFCYIFNFCNRNHPKRVSQPPYFLIFSNVVVEIFSSETPISRTIFLNLSSSSSS